MPNDSVKSKRLTLNPKFCDFLNCVSLGKLLDFMNLSFHICTPQSCYEEQMI